MICYRKYDPSYAQSPPVLPSTLLPHLISTHVHLKLVIVLRYDIRNILQLHLDHQGQFLVSRQPRASAAFEYIPNSIERTTMLWKYVDMMRFLWVVAGSR